ncbi:hypothetical protein L5515_019555 [Caenorhabditis briggsae]|uniref:Uncharacterized protein n=1 Tax=Caenorhabditis briggsae TaxID=6238 RepID=A0AAE9FEZ2_CAEBR|nr:hypothetical protein L5515_019555 [Caenorhabditis briggsae]
MFSNNHEEPDVDKIDNEELDDFSVKILHNIANGFEWDGIRLFTFGNRIWKKFMRNIIKKFRNNYLIMLENLSRFQTLTSAYNTALSDITVHFSIKVMLERMFEEAIGVTFSEAKIIVINLNVLTYSIENSAEDDKKNAMFQ